MRILSSIGAAALVATLSLTAGTASAESQKECSAKYKAAKAGNTLNGLTYAQFRKAQCAADSAATPAPAAPAATPAAAPKPAPAPAPMKTAAPAPTATTPTATGPIVFPTAISPTYSTLSAGKARFKTCDDQYKANKATNSNGGLKWIEKGGGYYSECNKKLKS